MDFLRENKSFAFVIRQAYVSGASKTTKMKLLSIISLIFVAQVQVPFVSFIFSFDSFFPILFDLKNGILVNRFAARISHWTMEPSNVLRWVSEQ